MCVLTTNSSDETPKTRRMYLEDMFLLEINSRIVAVRDGADLNSLAVLESVMYPGGGGQKCDIGKLIINGFEYDVILCKNEDGIVWHSFHSTQPHQPIAVNDACIIQVNPDTRHFHSRLHTAGHLIDAAFGRIGVTDDQLLPTKGFHFPEGPYVEYQVLSVEFDCNPDIVSRLNAALNDIVLEDCPVEIYSNIDKDLAISKYHVRPELIPDNLSHVRLVGVGSCVTLESGERISVSICPCGGTHVSSSRHVGRVSVSKMKMKGKALKVHYSVS